NFHLLLGITVCDLLGRFGVNNLVTHADEPDARRLVRMHGADGRAAHRAGARAAERAAVGAEQTGHLAERATIESLLRRGDLLGLQDVELDDVFGALELAHSQELAR